MFTILLILTLYKLYRRRANKKRKSGGFKNGKDCSSAVISAWEYAGVPVKTKGASYTGNMEEVFLKCGFFNILSKVNVSTQTGLKRGDVLLNRASHTALYLGNGQIAAATLNENGSTKYGKPGDQTGREICIQNYYNFPWDRVLHYTADDSTPTPPPSTGNARIREGQTYANTFAKTGISITGVRDAATKKAGIKVLQTALNKDYGSGLDVDGIWGNASSESIPKIV